MNPTKLTGPRKGLFLLPPFCPRKGWTPQIQGPEMLPPGAKFEPFQTAAQNLEAFFCPRFCPRRHEKRGQSPSADL